MVILSKKSKKGSSNEWVIINEKKSDPCKGKKYKEKTVITKKSRKTGKIKKENRYKYHNLK